MRRMKICKAPIEDVVELVPAAQYASDVFTNKNPLWRPPGARGIYGGTGIAQCLAAAYLTIPEGWTCRSMHCYFVLAGNSEDPIIYSVERVRDVEKSATRTVQARQGDRLIFTTTLSFEKEDVNTVSETVYQSLMPKLSSPLVSSSSPGSWDAIRPFELRKAGILNVSSKRPQDKRIRQWIRARNYLSVSAGHAAHLCALAYMSDSYFIGTVSRVHRIPRYTSREALQRADEWLKTATDPEGVEIGQYMMNLAELEAAEFSESKSNESESGSTPYSPAARQDSDKEISMMVSLSHSIYFHRPRAFRADEWILSELESPWAGSGRGLVMQKMWSETGVLIATCVQEFVFERTYPYNITVLLQMRNFEGYYYRSLIRVSVSMGDSYPDVE